MGRLVAPYAEVGGAQLAQDPGLLEAPLVLELQAFPLVPGLSFPELHKAALELLLRKPAQWSVDAVPGTAFGRRVNAFLPFPGRGRPGPAKKTLQHRGPARGTKLRPRWSAGSA